MHFRKPSPAAIVALLALFFALGGTAVAAKHYLITSTSQIKPSILQKLRGKTGPEGPQGPAGPQGAAGPSSLSQIIEVAGPKNPVPAKKVASSAATCPPGTHVVGGGDSMFAGEVAGFDSEAERPQSWFVIVSNISEFEGGWVQAIAYCAGAGQAVSASVQPSSHPAEAKAIRVMETSLSQRLTAARP